MVSWVEIVRMKKSKWHFIDSFLALTACFGNPCSNGATCVLDDDDGYYCENCPSDFEGKNCDKGESLK